ncbi:GNAT family N-acetyltransferase [Betaproteobacteria bacterium GR16-43]|nr:GNAT family N-acetyltransferase [Betaproteobacteria bacterium GR16-43]
MFQLEDVIEEKFPDFNRKPALITRPALAFLRKVVREQEVNDFLAQNEGLEGIEFIDRILEHFNFSYSIDSRAIENIPSEGRVVIVANHPLGLMDGIALLKVVSKVRKDVRIVANDILMRFPPLHPLLLPVANLGAGYNKANVAAIHDALANDEAVIIFPSGEVSRAGFKGIRDGRWQAGFLRFAEQAKAPLLPVHLDGRNSALFYGVSTVFKPLSSLMLFSEAMRQRNVKLPVHIGEIIPWKEIAAVDIPRAQKIRRIASQLYGISKPSRVLEFRTEKPIAHPENRLDLRRELRAAERLGQTTDGKEIFLFTARGNSAVMRELGRLREIAFRQVGEGTGKRRDLDAFDCYYKHVILWDEAELQVVGAYRIGEVQDILAKRGVEGLYTHTLFSFDEGLRAHFSQSLELGRSFVQPRYQGLRALEYLWQGIGAYLASRPQVRYLFGPVSVSAGYPEKARKLLVYFYRLYFGVPERLATPLRPYVITEAEERELSKVIPGDDYTRDFRSLKQRLAEFGVNVPTLYKQYTELCDEGGARFLGFGIDPAFSGCVDGLVVVDLLRVKASKRERYLRTPLPTDTPGSDLLRSA